METSLKAEEKGDIQELDQLLENTSELCEFLHVLGGSILARPKHDLQRIVDGEASETEDGYPARELFQFIRIRAIAFRDRRDIRKAMTDFIDCIHSSGDEFWYVMQCEHSVVSLYVGVCSASGFKPRHLGGHFKGMLPGSSVEELPGAKAKEAIVHATSEFPVTALITGMPTCDAKQNETAAGRSQEEKARNGIERLIDALAGEDFTLSFIGKPMTPEELQEFRLNTAFAYDALKPYAKYQQNIGVSQTIGHSLTSSESHTSGTNSNISETSGTSKTEGHSHSQTQSSAQTEGESSTQTLSENTSKAVRVKEGSWWYRLCKMWGWSKAKKWGSVWSGGEVPEHTSSDQHGTSNSTGKTSSTTKNTGTADSVNTSETETSSVTKAEGQMQSDTQSTSEGKNETSGWTTAQTREQVNLDLESATARLGKLHERLAAAPGMWKTSVMLYARDLNTLQRAVQAGFSIWRGEDSGIDPLTCHVLPNPSEGKAARTQRQILSLENNIIVNGELQANHPLGAAYGNLYTCLTSREFAKMADLPHWDVPGLQVRKLVEYGRMVDFQGDAAQHIEVGRILDRTSDRFAPCSKLAHPLNIDFAALNRHCFVSGITGAGKTNTMQVLIQALANHEPPIPFMVIEPVKSEYRKMKKDLPELDVYELGSDDFAINPFSFAEGANLASHIDSLTAAFNALMGSYSSMPFLVNELIVSAYEECGWNTETGCNEKMEEEWQTSMVKDERARWELFQAYLPTLEDLSDERLDAVLQSNFGDGQSEYRNSLRGALSARLKALRRSHKGHLLNRKESVCFKNLLKRNVVFEIQDFTDNDEKSFIMALLLDRIYEYRRLESKEGQVEPGLRHVVVLEEAHRLLSKATGSGSELTANPKAKAAEIFTDMLAEIRSYGQGMIIVDQIPSRLVPEVLKNTDVKITHKLTAKDDREAMGAAMNLQQDQVEELACHVPGEATVSFGGISQALHVKITPYKD